MTDEQPILRNEAGQFLKGSKGLGGRKLGARAKLGEAFVQALQEDFAEHGVAAIEAVRTDKPDQYLKVIAGLLPRDVNLTLNTADDLTDDEIIERIRALDATIQPYLALAATNGAGRGAEGSEGNDGLPKQPGSVH